MRSFRAVLGAVQGALGSGSQAQLEEEEEQLRFIPRASAQAGCSLALHILLCPGKVILLHLAAITCTNEVHAARDTHLSRGRPGHALPQGRCHLSLDIDGTASD